MKLDKVMSQLPYFCSGLVVKGFGRGSKELGIPTANFPESVVDGLPSDFPLGIYYGFAQVNSGDVHKMVLSVGWNPYYKNRKKSMETHIMHKYSEDFYGSTLNIVMIGYIRGEKNFNNIDELISAINDDIRTADEKLELPECSTYKNNPFFAPDVNDNLTKNSAQTTPQNNSNL